MDPAGSWPEPCFQGPLTLHPGEPPLSTHVRLAPAHMRRAWAASKPFHYFVDSQGACTSEVGERLRSKGAPLPSFPKQRVSLIPLLCSSDKDESMRMDTGPLLALSYSRAWSEPHHCRCGVRHLPGLWMVLPVAAGWKAGRARPGPVGIQSTVG